MLQPDKLEELVFDPETYFQGLLKDIAEASDEIILETYIFQLDDVGWAFVEALKKACARGVRVRLLIDGVGSYLNTSRLVKLLESDRSQIRIFHPLPWDFKAFRNALSAGHHVSDFLSYLATINRRNHRKLCIIDSKIAWLGSFNITADHYNQQVNNSDNNWHDTGLRICNEAVGMLRQNFEQVWLRKGESRTQRTRQFLAYRTIKGRQQSAHELFELLRHARQRIYMTNAYFNPSKRLLSILKQQVEKGVSIQLIVPVRSDVFFFPGLARTYYADLLTAGIRVFEFQRRVLHSKTMLVDNVVVVGSTNLNYRSLIHDLELDALVYGEEAVKQMEAKFAQDLQNCREITLRQWRNYPLFLKWLAWLPRLFRYWL